MKRPPPEECRDEKPVGFQCAARLYKLPDWIVGPVERQRMDHKIMRAFGQIEHRIVGHDPCTGQPVPPNTGKSSHDDGRSKGLVNLAQSFLDLVGNFLVQEKLRPLLQGAGAPGKKGAAVGKVGRMGHDRRN